MSALDDKHKLDAFRSGGAQRYVRFGVVPPGDAHSLDGALLTAVAHAVAESPAKTPVKHTHACPRCHDEETCEMDCTLAVDCFTLEGLPVGSHAHCGPCGAVLALERNLGPERSALLQRARRVLAEPRCDYHGALYATCGCAMGEYEKTLRDCCLLLGRLLTNAVA